MTEKLETKSISKSWELPHAPAKVWRALTEPELIAQWMLMETDLRLDQGAEFTFRQQAMGAWDGVVHSKILESVPQKRLSYAWISRTGANLDTTVTWTLTPIPGGTRLELEHRGFQPGVGNAFAGAQQGWVFKVEQKLAALLGTMSAAS